MNVRAGTPADAAVAAALHASEISEGFLPTLGSAFLGRLYRRIAKWPGSFLLVAEEQGHVVGMASGAEDVGALYRAFVIHDGFGAGLAAAPRILRSWRKALETLRYPSGEAGLPRAELLSLAVAPDYRGHGIGRALAQAVVAEFRRRGVGAARVVVGAGNAAAVGVYTSAGFQPRTAVEVHKGSRSELLVWAEEGRTTPSD